MACDPHTFISTPCFLFFFLKLFYILTLVGGSRFVNQQDAAPTQSGNTGVWDWWGGVGERHMPAPLPTHLISYRKGATTESVPQTDTYAALLPNTNHHAQDHRGWSDTQHPNPGGGLGRHAATRTGARPTTWNPNHDQPTRTGNNTGAHQLPNTTYYTICRSDQDAEQPKLEKTTHNPAGHKPHTTTLAAPPTPTPTQQNRLKNI